MNTLQNLLTGALSAAAGPVTTLYPPIQGPALLLGLATLTVPALRTVLRYQLHAKAVDKATAHDLHALFHAFGATETGPADQGPPLPWTVSPAPGPTLLRGCRTAGVDDAAQGYADALVAGLGPNWPTQSSSKCMWPCISRSAVSSPASTRPGRRGS
ncbi:hypothetical protein ACFVRB_38875 [Streptomyces nojiriensis]|uniref:hypothetical protein n=1 Tax=Streptomyces nojiriensis TaxID=66374 RepID=UPI0036D812CB